MSIIEPGSASSGLIARVQALLTRTDETWGVIADEPATEGGLFRSYVIPLAAIPAVASAIGMLVFGFGAFGVSVRLSPLWIVASGVIGFALSLGSVWLSARVINALAPSFGGTADLNRAVKVAAFAPTAYWVIGVVTIFPAVAVVSLVGAIWSLILLFKGLPRLMGAPADRALPYTAAVAVVMFVLGLVAGMAVGAVTSRGMMSGLGPGIEGTVTIPGQGEIDIGKLQSAAEKMAKAAEAGEGVAATSPEALQALLPGSLAGAAKENVRSSSGGVAGFEGSGARADYVRGESRIELSVTDIGAAGAIAGLAGAMNARQSETTATGYEKAGMVDGKLTIEKYETPSRSGEYGVLIGERFMVQAEGQGISMDELKAAVRAVDAGKLEAMAKSAN